MDSTSAMYIMAMTMGIMVMTMDTTVMAMDTTVMAMDIMVMVMDITAMEEMEVMEMAQTKIMIVETIMVIHLLSIALSRTILITTYQIALMMTG